MTTDVLLVTATVMPKPDPETHLLREALFALGVRAEMAGWDDPNINWTQADLVLIRTPWNYASRPSDFLAWAETVAAQTTMRNGYDTIAWNAHKKYLLDLARAGVHTLPTTLIAKGATEIALKGDDLVVKPAVGVGANGALRGRGDAPALRDHALKLAQSVDVLVQPFAPDVTHGEISLIYFDGAFAHAVRKVPQAGDYRVQHQYGGTVFDHAPTPAEFAVAERAIAAAPGALAYVRVDLVPYRGAPAVMELECIEPELFLGRTPVAPAKFAAVIQNLLA